MDTDAARLVSSILTILFILSQKWKFLYYQDIFDEEEFEQW